MGMFSFDVHEVLPDGSSRRRAMPIECYAPAETVYLIRPDGGEPLVEHAYKGYGRFAGTNLHVVLAKQNLAPEIADKLDEEMMRKAGILMASGVPVLIAKDGTRYCSDDYSMACASLGFVVQANVYPKASEFEVAGETATAIEHGRARRLSRVEEPLRVRYPLKLSFSRDVSYSEIPASKVLPAG
ncbi:hypothetical protein [Ferrimonas marina]|uniref:Uncharacterized protein n=1 Tax=Ferrimonas marina TaxID=299255 RepID=A0A1M5U157_9GAMM|nr:hypothetical protein [Ferrimonas marina]SHH56698.1 hypothetical protein SAMN02745129_2362 [Ferrimonas marina]